MRLWAWKGGIVDLTEVERYCEELRTGAENLAENAAETSRALEFIAEMLAKHNAQTVEALPAAIQATIATRMRGVKPEAWIENELKRLHALNMEVLGHLMLFGPLRGPVN
jgi:hypothetical protein